MWKISQTVLISVKYHFFTFWALTVPFNISCKCIFFRTNKIRLEQGLLKLTVFSTNNTFIKWWFNFSRVQRSQQKYLPYDSKNYKVSSSCPSLLAKVLVESSSWNLHNKIQDLMKKFVACSCTRLQTMASTSNAIVS